MSTIFVLNTKVHHVSLSWVIYSSKQIKYDIKENNHFYWLNKSQRHNTAIYGLKLFHKNYEVGSN